MVRHVVSMTSTADAQSLAADALDLPDAATVRRRLRDWCTEHYESDLFYER
jgi:hypothetical protein